MNTKNIILREALIIIAIIITSALLIKIPAYFIDIHMSQFLKESAVQESYHNPLSTKSLAFERTLDRLHNIQYVGGILLIFGYPFHLLALFINKLKLSKKRKLIIWTTLILILVFMGFSIIWIKQIDKTKTLVWYCFEIKHLLQQPHDALDDIVHYKYHAAICAFLIGLAFFIMTKKK